MPRVFTTQNKAKIKKGVICVNMTFKQIHSKNINEVCFKTTVQQAT